MPSLLPLALALNRPRYRQPDSVQAARAADLAEQALQWCPFDYLPIMIQRFHSWPERPHQVMAVMLAVAICGVPVVLPYANLANLPVNLFAYLFCCVLVYPFAALLRHRVTSLPAVWAIAALFLLAACFYHTNIMAETANSAWRLRRDATLAKFGANLPQLTLGVLCWWLLVLRPDRRERRM